MEEAVKNTEGVKNATLSFMTLKLKVEFEDGVDPQEVMEKARENCFINFLLNIDLSKPIEVMAKVRYRAKLAEATLYPQVEGKVKVEFKNPQRAITPGQSVVFYIENILLGGGKISSNV